LPDDQAAGNVTSVRPKSWRTASLPRPPPRQALPMTNNSGLRSLLQTLAIEIAVPTAAYYGLHAFGVSVFLSLALSGLVPLGRTLFQFAKDRTINGLALVVLVTNVVGM